MTMISPTVGRIVWFHPNGNEAANDLLASNGSDQPMAASVAYVWGDTLVNLDVIDHSGAHAAFTSVTLIQDGYDIPASGECYCEWMPYQKGQAAKYEALAGAAQSPAVQSEANKEVL